MADQLDLSAKYEDTEEDAEIAFNEAEEVEVIDVSPEPVEETEEVASTPEVVDTQYAPYNSPLEFYKEVTAAQTELFKGGHYDQVKIAYIGKDWVVISGTDIVEIAESLGLPYEYARIGRMTKMEANAYYFKYLLANGNLTKTQQALLAAKFIVVAGVPAVNLVELHSDQLTNINVSNALSILSVDPDIFGAMLHHSKIKLSTGYTSSLKAVKQFVEARALRRKKEQEQLQSAARDFIRKQASNGVQPEDLAKVMRDIASSLEK